MTAARTNDLREALRAAILAADSSLSVAQIDALAEVDSLMRQLYPVVTLVRMARHHIIRSFLQEDVDEHGVRRRIAIVQPRLITDDAGADREPHGAVYLHRDNVADQPLLAQQALLKLRGAVLGLIKRSPLVTAEIKISVLKSIETAFDELLSELG